MTELKLVMDDILDAMSGITYNSSPVPVKVSYDEGDVTNESMPFIVVNVPDSDELYGYFGDQNRSSETLNIQIYVFASDNLAATEIRDAVRNAAPQQIQQNTLREKATDKAFINAGDTPIQSQTVSLLYERR
jgi:hypothetical protein